MAETLFLPDGSNEVLLSDGDFQRLVYEKLGREAEQKIIELIEKADYTNQSIDTDLRSYESSLESNKECFDDLLDDIRRMADLLEAPRLDKSRILKLLGTMQKQINNQI